MPNGQATAFFQSTSTEETKIQKALIEKLNEIKIHATTGTAEERARYAPLRRICTKIKGLAKLKNKKFIPTTNSTSASEKPKFDPETDVALLDPTVTIEDVRKIWTFLAGITIISERKHVPRPDQNLKDRLPIYFIQVEKAFEATGKSIESNQYQVYESMLSIGLEAICELVFDLVKCQMSEEERKSIECEHAIRGMLLGHTD